MYTENTAIAVIESTWAVHRYEGQATIRVRRQMPQNLSVALNLNLQLGMGPGAPSVPADLQEALRLMLEQLQPQILQQAQRAVQEALKLQAPVVSVEAALLGGKWVKHD